jgi:hypothetical protein
MNMNSIARSTGRLRIQAEDTLRFHPEVRNLLASSILLRTPAAPAKTPSEAVTRLRNLCNAARLASSESLVEKAESEIARQLAGLAPSSLPWDEFVPDFRAQEIPKAIILKRYISEREKGVLFVSFDTQMARLAKANLPELARRYTLVLAPQWSRPHSVSAYLFPLVWPDRIVSLISNERDLVYMPRINGKYQMVRLYASSWVDPRAYSPVPHSEKTIDIFMLANFGKYKRHHALFAALRDLPREYRVVLNGQSETGRSKETILAEAEMFGVKGRFEVEENVTDRQLNFNIVHSKISIILSRREGSCVAVVESIFANTPVGVYRDAEVGSRAFINQHTGRLLEHHGLGTQLSQFVQQSAGYEPRKWALENSLACRSSSKTLNEVLKQNAASDGMDWTEDIADLHWRPDPRYCETSDLDRLFSEYPDFAERFGITIGRFHPSDRVRSGA